MPCRLKADDGLPAQVQFQFLACRLELGHSAVCLAARRFCGLSAAPHGAPARTQRHAQANHQQGLWATT